MKKVILMMSVLLSAGWFCAFRILRSTPISTIATILSTLWWISKLPPNRTMAINDGPRTAV